MAKLDYKKMLKADWQKVAGKHNVEFKAKSTVRYLVEKVAEKIGVDDKIVDDEDLKKAVCEKLNTSKKKAPAKKKSTCEIGSIEKTRHYVQYCGHTWEIDEFHAENQGLIVAEIELNSEDEEFNIPDNRY